MGGQNKNVPHTGLSLKISARNDTGIIEALPINDVLIHNLCNGSNYLELKLALITSVLKLYSY